MAEPNVLRNFDRLSLDEEILQNKAKALIVLDNGAASFQKSLWPKLKTLTHLDLSECNIATLPDAICDLAALGFFKAANNLLTCLPISIGQLKGLMKLILPFNKLSTLPSSFSELNALEHLNLSHNEFKGIPNCFQEGSIQINYFDISYNKLEDWSVGPLCGFALKFLNCSHNCLKTNPSWLWGDFCQSLEELDISFNCFSNPASMVKTYTIWRTGVDVRLKDLNLCKSGINSNHLILLHHLKAVKKLNLGNVRKEHDQKFPSHYAKDNFIWQLAFKQFQCANVLTELSLGGIGLASLPDDISCLQVLEFLDCQDNQLQWLPDTFSELSKLRIAIFSNNKLLYLPQDFGKLTFLEELWLDSNELGELPSSCSSLQELKWLDLYGNNFENLPSCLLSILKNLDGLDLEYNYFDFQTLMDERVDFPSNLCQSLKEALRQYAQADAMKKVMKIDRLKTSCEDHDYSSDSKSERSSDCNSSICEDDSKDLGENTVSDAPFEEEVWDLDDGEDDYYDPTYVPSRTLIKMPRRALIIQELVLRPNSFLPSDIHPSPSVRANKDPFVAAEGQFDDA